MAITGGYVMVNGIKTYYETNNGPKNPKGTIVCLHTAGRESRQYHGIMEIFADKYTVVAFDMPAHGKSWPLPGNVGISNYKDYGKFVWDFTKAMGIEDVIIIGCSVGGNMVYHIAEEYPVKAMVSMQGSPRILAMGTAYGIWTGIGALGAVIVGILAFQEPVTVPRLIFVGLLLVGIVGLKLTSA